MKRISIYSNKTKISEETAAILKEKFRARNYVVSNSLHKDSELLITIGGDGSTLEAIHKYDFPHVPIIGINTGHLGFFQEIHPDQLEEFIENYENEKYRLQPLTTAKATVNFISGDCKTILGLNEIVIRGSISYTSHFNISIGDSFIERFSGDGILVATSAGSTAYNYSLGGAIVDPRLELLQVTPLAPMNTTAYRAFTSSILLPLDLSIDIEPEYTKDTKTLVINDGIEHSFKDVKSIRIEKGEEIVNLLRFESYDFWNKVKTKFL
ncbi:MAG: NAD(+)/NADH kinase [Anaerovoracaceae bacterium]